MASYQQYPPPLSPDQTKYILSEIKDWSILNGLIVRPSPAYVSREIDPSGSLAVTAPVTLFPSIFPRSCFDEALAIQNAYNELYAAIARDEDWLSRVVEEYAKSSPFNNLSCLLSRLFRWKISLKIVVHSVMNNRFLPELVLYTIGISLICVL